MRNIFGLFGMFSWALAATCSSMVSNIMGQGLQHRVLELIWKIVKVSTGIALFVCLVLNLFPYAFLSVYGQSTDWVNACHTCSENCIFCTGNDVFFGGLCKCCNRNRQYQGEFADRIHYNCFVLHLCMAGIGAPEPFRCHWLDERMDLLGFYVYFIFHLFAERKMEGESYLVL